MNFLDVLILLPLLYGAWIGFRKGLVIEVCTLLAFVLGIWGGINFSDFVADLISSNMDVETEYLPVIAFTLTFLIVGAIVFFAGKAIEKVVNVAALKPINKLGGLGFGIAKFLFILSVGLVILDVYDSKSSFIPQKMKTESLLYQPVKDLSLKTLPALQNSTLFQKGLIEMTTKDSTLTLSENPIIPE